MSSLRALMFAVALLIVGFDAAQAHEVRPAFLQILESPAGEFEVTWKQPVAGTMAIHLVPQLSNGWLQSAPQQTFATASFRIQTWHIHSQQHDPLSGQILSIEGLDRTITDAIVSVTLADGRTFNAILKPEHTSLRLAFQQSSSLEARAYFGLGVEHILTGFDHLAFVLGLLLLVGIRWQLIKAITAFTAAHSITLGASAIGLVHAPSAVIEALVALSIVFVAAECTNSGRRSPGLAARQPWLIAFIFGLLHGFAFAGALAEIGLPKNAITESLLLFNAGVEVGQLLFVSAAILVILALRRLTPHLSASWYALARKLPSHVIGYCAAFWLIERTVATFG
jgi:hydrogenase/urease accessory protein HupE